MKKSILLVDDEPAVRESLGKALRSEDYAVEVASNGQEAIEKFKPGQIDLLLLDLNMPVKDGWNAFEQLTAMNPLVPIIIITGRPEQYELASAAGAGALLEKPLDIPALLQTISDLLEEPPMTRLKRLCGEQSMLRYRPPSNERFRQMLHERYATPYPFTAPYSHGGLNE